MPVIPRNGGVGRRLIRVSVLSRLITGIPLARARRATWLKPIHLTSGPRLWFTRPQRPPARLREWGESRSYPPSSRARSERRLAGRGCRLESNPACASYRRNVFGFRQTHAERI